MKAEITETLDYLCRQLGELDVATILPDDIERHDIVLNRAIDFRTACMQYLTVHIHHDATPLGTIGSLSHFVMKFCFVNWFRESSQNYFQRRWTDNRRNICLEILDR